VNAPTFDSLDSRHSPAFLATAMRTLPYVNKSWVERNPKKDLHKCGDNEKVIWLCNGFMSDMNKSWLERKAK
jgi:hypothetical protein